MQAPRPLQRATGPERLLAKPLPSLNELYNLIIDKEPLIKLRNCKVNNPNLNL